MSSLVNVAAVAVGGGLGAASRYAIALWLPTGRFFIGTLAANVIGSFVLGALIKHGIADKASDPWRLFLTTGFCGGFTTYSTFNHEALSHFERGDHLGAVGYIGVTLVSCGLAAAAGYWVGGRLS